MLSNVSLQHVNFFQVLLADGKAHLLKNTSYKNEQDYYRGIFEEKFAGCGAIVPYIWMPRYTNATDPSARTLIEYK